MITLFFLAGFWFTLCLLIIARLFGEQNEVGGERVECWVMASIASLVGNIVLFALGAAFITIFVAFPTQILLGAAGILTPLGVFLSYKGYKRLTDGLGLIGWYKNKFLTRESEKALTE